MKANKSILYAYLIRLKNEKIHAVSKYDVITYFKGIGVSMDINDISVLIKERFLLEYGKNKIGLNPRKKP
ncbi:MAG: hypothetical protein ACMXYK_01670 [Candidatus Woesearchaeota archaeon]